MVHSWLDNSEELQLCDTPEKAAEYWRCHIATEPRFDPEQEHFAVLLFNIQARIKDHHVVSVGTVDSNLTHPREVIRAAIVAAAGSSVLLQNHSSGDPNASEADITVTRELSGPAGSSRSRPRTTPS